VRYQIILDYEIQSKNGTMKPSTYSHPHMWVLYKNNHIKKKKLFTDFNGQRGQMDRLA